MNELAADGVHVAVTCRALKFTKQPYYRWLQDPVSRRDRDDAHLINAAIDVHADDPAFGYRFIADELAEAGFTASERRVWRACSENEIFSAFVRKAPRQETSCRSSRARRSRPARAHRGRPEPALAH
ncbi:MAG: transposase [Microbacterium sp.]|nr:transposase [Microbacterium sp.]OJU70156.1 MAG: hypothetical protein BGO04_05620 [Microbacterium sp. 70-38]